MAHCVRVLTAQAWAPEFKYQNPSESCVWPRVCLYTQHCRDGDRKMAGAKWPSSRFGEKLCLKTIKLKVTEQVT